MPTPRTIIVADDEEPIVTLVEIILAAHGFRVLTCLDGVAAFELFLRQPYEIALIICDFRLPKIGPITLREFIAESDFPVPPILVFSGLLDHRHLDELTRGGLTDVLLKPFSPEALHQAVRALITARVEAVH